MTSLELKIEGMMCGHCSSFVSKNFQSIEGVKEVEVDLKKATANIHYDENEIQEEVLRSSLKDTSYNIIEV